MLEDVRPLPAEWRLHVSAAGAFSAPREIAGEWIAAQAPGTAAQALLRAGRWDDAASIRLHDLDVWYSCEADIGEADALRFESLASIAEIFIDGEVVALSDTMFAPLDVPLPRRGRIRLDICFRSLNRYLAGLKGKRARWRTSLVETQNLRFVRTTLLGHMSGWQPPVDLVGPMGEITLHRRGGFDATGCAIETRFTNGVAELVVWANHVPHGAQLHCAGETCAFEQHGEAWQARLALKDAEPWFPHTHGRPALYEAEVRTGEGALSLGRVGFRTVSIDRGHDGTRFGFLLNGERIFARGACWTPGDPLALPQDKPAYLRDLGLMRDAGFNMVRVPGITLYAPRAFFEAASELGLMVWQDLQFANFDYPFADEAFRNKAEAEVAHMLHSARGQPSLIAVCGGSEVMQQAAMIGLPETTWRSASNAAALRPMVEERRGDVIFIENSPCDGALPFQVNHGVGHYYGVGAYMRPLEDARRADVAFAAECLAFSNVPDAATLRRLLPGAAPVHHPLWKRGVPRDRGASWDFEDVREFYMQALYSVDPARLRREDPTRYLDFARAAPAEVMEATFAEWRRPGSRTSGALAFLWKDAMAGAGWGLIDVTGRPKSVWYALKRALQPVQVSLTDEGVNGLAAHVCNEMGAPVALTLEIACLSRSGDIVAGGSRVIELAARGAITLNAVELIGAFFDVNYAYRFGPAAHCAVVAWLKDETGAAISRAFHFPLGRVGALDDPGLSAALLCEREVFALAIEARGIAQTVAIDMEGWLPDDNYFHLAPGVRRSIALRPVNDAGGKPSGSVAALNSVATLHF